MGRHRLINQMKIHNITYMLILQQWQNTHLSRQYFRIAYYWIFIMCWPLSNGSFCSSILNVCYKSTILFSSLFRTNHFLIQSQLIVKYLKNHAVAKKKKLLWLVSFISKMFLVTLLTVELIFSLDRRWWIRLRPLSLHNLFSSKHQALGKNPQE